MAKDQSTWTRRLFPATAFQLCFVAAVTLLKAAANALVLSRFQISALPYLYVGAAAITAAATGLFASRRGQPTELAPLGGAIAAITAAGIHLGFSSLAPLAYLFSETFATWVAIAFWNAVDDAFDAREARRAYTAISGIGMAGGIAGGLLAQELAMRLGANALLVAGAALLVTGGLAFRFHRTPPHARQRGAQGSTAEVYFYLRRHAYGRLLALLIFTLSVLSAFADFLFRQRASEALNEDQLASLFGNLQLWVGLICASFQLVFAEPLLRHLGLLRYVGTAMALLTVLASAALFQPTLGPAYLLKLFEQAASLSLLPVAMQLLYAPVPDAVRDGVRGALDGLVKKGGLALGGLVLVGSWPFASGSAVAAGALATSVAAGLIVLLLRPLYLAALKERVSGADARTGAALDGVGEEVWIDALSSRSAERVLNAVALMEQAGIELLPHLPQLLQHEHERVLERGVQLALSLKAVQVADQVERLLSSPHRRPRDEAVWALAALAPERAARVLPPLLDAKDVGLRCAAIGALMGLGGGEVAQAALQRHLARLEAAPVAERREMARLLGRLRNERWAGALARYLEDGDGSVRRIAIAAVGEGGYASLAGRLLPFLTWREERRIAREALSRLGDAVTPLVERAMNDRSRPASLRYELPRVLRQIGTARALEALLFSNIHDDAFLHYRIGVALSRLREAKPELPVDGVRVREAIGRRREVYRTLVGPYRDLRAGLGDSSLLTRAVGDRLDQAYELSFWLLGLLYDARALRRVHAHLLGGDARRRAWALELLENMVPEPDRALVLEQTEGHHRDLPVGAAGRLFQHLPSLCHSDDHVLRACAREVARRFGLWTLPPLEDDMSEETVKRLFALEGVEIFAQSDVDDLAAVAAASREQSFRKGERIYSEGDPGDALYVIVRGAVEARRGGESVLVLKEKEAFGEVSLLDGSPRPTDVVALEDTRVLVIDRRDFLDLVSDRPELLKGVFRVVAGQLKRVLDGARRT